MNRTLTSLLMFLSTALLAVAQDPGDSRSKDTGGRKAWFVQTGIPEGLENPIKVMTGTEVGLVTLSNRLASGPVKIPSDGMIRVVREIPDPEDPSKRKMLKLAEAKVPENSNDVLIILVPVPKKEGSDLVFMTKVQGLSDFRGGDCLYLNLTNLNVGIEIGTSKFPLEPGSSKIYDGEAFASATSVPFRYSYFRPEKKKWKVLSASMTIMTGTRREVWVFSIDGAADRVRCHSVTFPVL